MCIGSWEASWEETVKPIMLQAIDMHTALKRKSRWRHPPSALLVLGVVAGMVVVGAVLVQWMLTAAG